MRYVILAALAQLVSASGAFPQAPDGTAARDSAQVARAAWSRAVAALRSNDLAGARGEAEHAAQAWPTQPAYLWGRAIVAARSGDTTALVQALGAYADLGLGRDLRADSVIARYASLPALEDLARRHDANRAALSHGRVVYTFPDSTFWPEGVDADPRTHCFYLTSVRHRTIAEACPSKPVREMLARDEPSAGAVLAARVDAARGVLWATMSGLPQMSGYTPADSAIGALVRVRISDGRIEHRWDLPVETGGHALGDLVIGRNGDVFITDSNHPYLYRLRPGSDSLERITHPLFRSLQGMAPSPDGGVLYIADYSHGLLRVDLSTNRVIRLTDPPNVTSLGVDGIALDRGAIVAVQNGVQPSRIMRYVLDATGERIVRAEVLDRDPVRADEPTAGIVVGRTFVYVANSQWEKFGADGTPRQGAVLKAPVLLSVDLPP